MSDQPAKPKSVSYNAARGPCTVCAEPGLPCSRCRVDYYCGKAHQKADYHRHRKGCGVLEMRSSPELKRHLVATRDIPAGTVIMRELPLVCFPRPYLLPGQMLCVVCCRQLAGSISAWRQCGACGWPVCGVSCAQADVHRAECQAFQRSGFKVSKGDLRRVDADWMNALSTLRTCLAADTLPQLRDLQDHLNSDDALKSCPADQMGMLMAMTFGRNRVFDKTVAWLQQKAGITWIPADKLRRAVAANQINGFCDDTTGGGRAVGGLARGALYSGLCILEHSCASNTYMLLEVDETGQRLVMVSRDVKKGEHLSVDYQDCPFRSMSERRRDCCTRGFLCRCVLCEDPTELGLYLSSPCCKRCSKREKMTYIDGKCGGCGEETAVTMAEPNAEFRRLQAQDNPRRWERFVEQFLWPKGPLHPTHCMVLHAKMQVVEALERSQLGYQILLTTDDEAVRWESLCGDVLRALEVIRPGANAYTQSVLLATYHVKGLQMKKSLAGPRSRTHNMDMARDSVKIILQLEKMMIAGRAKEVLEELKSDWKDVFAMPKERFDAFIAG
ncbi:uncharacterized protein LOC117643160 [Thrips palmi]|uniref:Uncharacterized protein LOC117643160 n=1 Tax=Thrips palmi TaxID=161013 RepID=A0A6P8ZKV5_THRPL|nr:uncharacterized protein LOC117643160 [Thrips palmi]XP_034237765.1 uncharacterized protein LOC117643160 [Thrips palmi]XP_034237766.1 uncharacterized protein LOC117643160 [Thrips palmi]XP_034237767.1 uncharacterized protein LOC117643160 [Thrips palmi]XP_034237769.1 uncharacterized protein LOC117643160 [Thrips palmi]